MLKYIFTQLLFYTTFNKYPYQAILDYEHVESHWYLFNNRDKIGISVKFCDDVYDWLKENCSGCFLVSLRSQSIFFYKKTDYILWKMSWE